jgi:hypothetical protein
MGWKKYGGGKMFKFEDPGTELVGRWMGSRPSGKYDSRLGTIMDASGEKHVFSIATALSDIEMFPAGCTVRIVFLGWEQGNGGTRYKNFELFMDEAQENQVLDSVNKSMQAPVSTVNVGSNTQTATQAAAPAQVTEPPVPKFEASMDDVPF